MDSKALKGFVCASLKYKPSSLCSHTLYMKEHSVREHGADKPPGRTLFVLNVPPFVHSDNFNHIFANVGAIESVILQDKPSSSEKQTSSSSESNSNKSVGYKVAYIVFKNSRDLKKALTTKELQPVCEETDDSQNGVVRWIKEYNSSIPNPQKMQQEIENFMKKYDYELSEKMKQDKSLAEPDEDGWITVTRQGRKPGFERKETTGNKIMSKEKNRQEKRELKNFYTFQIRESKMKHIVTLRQKFEEDKKKIAKLKESRRFKPF